MSNEKKVGKRSAGRPAGREYTARLQILVTPETRAALDARADSEGRARSDVVRELIEKYLRRKSR
jgi:predicted DNA-binding protein